ncbi:MAG: HNH endonuclease, partial [Pirellulaceae bacterium]|nr:HNH endonuclease [Pirellulaceae bacterium]
MARIHDTSAWQRVRPQILERDSWTCRMCGIYLSSGKIKRYSAVVDHIRPHGLAPDLCLEPSNLWAVCKGCHDGPCQSIELKYAGDADAIAAAEGKVQEGKSYASGGTTEKSKMQIAVHPDVSKMVWKFNRWHHHVNYGVFKNQKLVRRADLSLPDRDNDYGMELVKVT